MLSRKHRVCSSFVALLCALVLGGLSYINVSAAEESETKFRGVGHYAFTTAGNNNVYRGDTQETAATTRKIITPEDNSSLPSNWETVKARILAAGYEINNLSGSYLDFTGDVKYAEVDYFNSRSNCGHGDSVEERQQSTNEIYLILIAESGNYTVIKNMHQDVTVFVNKEGSGWYYAAYYTPLIPDRCVQASWALTAVYEDSSLDNSYVELINPNMYFGPGSVSQSDRYFASELTPTSEVQLLGVYIGAGRVSWPAYTEQYNTRDHTYAILKDNSTKQLYETTYKGETIFKGRTAEDFASGIFDTLRSHDFSGGELDIFNETLGNDFFGNKEIIGYRVEKEQPDLYLEPVLFGLRKSVEAPDLDVEPVIPTEEPDHPEIYIRNISNYTACGVKMVLPLNQISAVTDVLVDPNENTQYEITDGNLIVTYNGALREDDLISVMLTTEKQTGKLLRLYPEVTFYPASSGVCKDEISGNEMFKQAVYGEDVVYRIMSQYVDENGKEIADPEYAYARIDDEYETTEKTINGYTLKQSPENKNGIVEGEDITVVYVYETDIAVPNTGGSMGGEKAIKGAVVVGVPIIIGGIGLIVYKYLVRRSKKVQFNK